jgi:transcriptional regulator with PAS, ATPase and Fis domain
MALMEIDQNSISKRINGQPDLHNILQAHYKDIEKYFSFQPLAMFFSDADGYILSIAGDERVLRLMKESQPTDLIGSSIKEHIVGTTAPGISLEEKRFACITAEEHYNKRIHWASCIATPVFDYEQNLLGCLDFTVPFHDAEKLRRFIPVLLSAANSIQFELSSKMKLDQLRLFQSYYRSTFEYAQSILMLVNAKGEIIDLNRRALEFFRINSENTKHKDIRNVLGVTQGVESLLRGSGGGVGMSFDAGCSHHFHVDSIPIPDQSGNGVVYLLKLEEKQKIYQAAIPEAVLNTPRYTFDSIIGTSPAIADVIGKAKKVAQGRSTVLLEGETGTGKELFAHAIHNESPFREGPFVALNCAAIPRELVESELFGYEKGAYTGAFRGGNSGKFEQANGGTIFLDEIHAMDLSAQSKILRVIEDRNVIRIGGKRSLPLDIRIIAASSVKLEEEALNGRFVQALLYRLNVVRLRIPNLKERKEDIPALVNHFIFQMNGIFHRTIQGIEPDALQLILQYSWPGNVRELRNCLEGIFNFCTGNVITLKDLADVLPCESAEEDVSGQDIDEITRNIMIKSLKKHGNVKAAAIACGIPLRTFYRKMKAFSIR